MMAVEPDSGTAHCRASADIAPRDRPVRDAV